MAAPTIGLRPYWAPSVGSTVERSHPLASGLVSFALLHGCDMVDIASQQILIKSGFGALVGSPYGPGALAGTSGWQYPDRSIMPTSAVSVMMVARMTTTGDNFLWGNSTSSGSDRASISLNYTGTGVSYWDWSGTSTGAGGGRVNGSGTYGGWDVWVMTAIGGSGAQVIYRNGAVFASSANSGGTRTTSVKEFYIGTAGGGSAAGTFNSVAVWSRALTAADAAALYANPFQMLRN